MVYVGSARIDENGQSTGGMPGDQTGQECMVEPWYLHPNGWYVIRAYDANKAALIAQDMVYLCDNPNIGYWDNSESLYNAAQPFGFNCSLVNTPCDTDCSKAVRVCCLYAGYNVPNFWTGNEIATLLATGEFYQITDPTICDTPTYLKLGDILVSRTPAHTVVVVSVDTPPTPPPITPSNRRLKPFLFINAMTHSRRARTRRNWYS